MIMITLDKIRAHNPCADGWEKLLKHIGKTKADDVPFPLATVLESNGLDDALWCTRALPEYDSVWRSYAASCARRVEHLLTDERSTNAIDVAEKHANGQATDDELTAARDAAWAAARAEARAEARAAALAAARAAARDAAMAEAWDAARAAAMAAARDEAWATDGDAAWATDGDAAGDAAWAEARAEAKEYQAVEFLRAISVNE